MESALQGEIADRLLGVHLDNESVNFANDAGMAPVASRSSGTPTLAPALHDRPSVAGSSKRRSMTRDHERRLATLPTNV